MYHPLPSKYIPTLNKKPSPPAISFSPSYSPLHSPNHPGAHLQPRVIDPKLHLPIIPAPVRIPHVIPHGDQRLPQHRPADLLELLAPHMERVAVADDAKVAVRDGALADFGDLRGDAVVGPREEHRHRGARDGGVEDEVDVRGCAFGAPVDGARGLAREVVVEGGVVRVVGDMTGGSTGRFGGLYGAGECEGPIFLEEEGEGVSESGDGRGCGRGEV